MVTGCRWSGRSRRGLSTLELVLSLPILLFLMALMVNFATVACWKIRASSMARDAAWENRAARGGYSYLPDYWPQAGGVSVGLAGDVPELNDPRADLPVVRGPFLPYGATVHRELLDPTLELRRGSALVERDFALLATMGGYRLEARSLLLDNKWQHGEMGVERTSGLRIPPLYELPTAPAAYGDAYVEAAMAIYYAPFREDLAPLDRDEEFRYYRALLHAGFGSSPDFHPRLASFCSIEPAEAADRVETLIDRIRGKVERDESGNVTRRVRGVSERMASEFISLYRQVIERFIIQSLPDPPPPGVQAEIQELEGKIALLTAFLQALEAGDG